MEPVTRRGMFLDAICDGEPCGLEPATREEMMLKRLAEGGGGVSSWNDLTDKPFGEVSEQAEVFNFDEYPEEHRNQNAFTGVDGYIGVAPDTMTYPIQLEEVFLADMMNPPVGEMVTVTYDDDAYECEIKQGNGGGMDWYIGNDYLRGDSGEDTGEPFCIQIGEIGFAVFIPGSNIKDYDTHGITVQMVAKTVKPIDHKYIILTSPNGTKYNLSVSDDGTLSAVAI